MSIFYHTASAADSPIPNTWFIEIRCAHCGHPMGHAPCPESLTKNLTVPQPMLPITCKVCHYVDRYDAHWARPLSNTARI